MVFDLDSSVALDVVGVGMSEGALLLVEAGVVALGVDLRALGFVHSQQAYDHLFILFLNLHLL